MLLFISSDAATRFAVWSLSVFFPTADLITMHPIQGTHIAAIFKLATQQLEALRVAPEIQKEYSEILVLREKIKLATDLKKARRQLLTR
ncbi:MULTISPECIES: hypothetical protein [unclassified Bradyrhizobium]|jgi:hypothetical protein|uniref:hypothetical protein n=1 Tax=unclassified Bradyrhizobium TaxID=2631580 RepID=UPI001FF853D5|nr:MULTISPECIES: hypothetical protein [unclassified Bradyrhizobium]